MDTILNYKEEDLDLGLDEGVNDPGIFKAVILAGGPGSGKSYVAKKMGLKTLGLIVVNSDLFFVQLLKRKGLSRVLATIAVGLNKRPCPIEKSSQYPMCPE